MGRGRGDQGSHLTRIAAKKRLPERFPKVTVGCTVQQCQGTLTRYGCVRAPRRLRNACSPINQLRGRPHHGIARARTPIGKTCEAHAYMTTINRAQLFLRLDKRSRTIMLLVSSSCPCNTILSGCSMLNKGFGRGERGGC